MLKFELIQNYKHSIKILLRRKNLRFLRRTNHYTNSLPVIMKNYILLMISILILGCSSQKIDKRYTSYEIEPSIKLTLNEIDSTYLNELRFTPYFDSKDLQKFLFQKYGKWDNLIITERKSPFLVWKDLKLFDWSEESFTIGASGEDSEFDLLKINGIQRKGKITYCSAIVLNLNGDDCLNDNYKEKDSIVRLFIRGTENINKNDVSFENEIKKLEVD